MLQEFRHHIERSIVIGNRRVLLVSKVSDLEPSEDIERFLQKSEAFLANVDAGLSSAEFHYGGWLLKAALSEDVAEIFELDHNSGELVLDITRSISSRRSQTELCDINGAIFDPPSITSYCAISQGVFDGLDVEGIRYPSPDHMSGWYITTELYDGDASSLHVEHLYHVCAQRPELVKFFGLPVGFGFSQRGSGGLVYFDENVANAEPDP